MLENLVSSIVYKTSADSYRFILSGVSNFRKEVDSTYKLNRKDSAKPKFYKELRDWARDFLSAEIAPEGLEADDYLGILQNEDTVIASNDKDLTMIPGAHLRIKKDWNLNEIISIGEDEAIYNFWYQMCVGDTTDNVKCLQGIGPVKASKLLGGGDWKNQVQDQYKKQFGDSWFEKFDTNARLLWIKRDLEKEYYDYV